MQKIALIIFVFITLPGLSQKSDSLKNLIAKDSTNADLYIKLCKEIRKTSAKDAEKYALRALALAEKGSDLEILDRALGEAGAVYYLLGDVPNASTYYNRRILVELQQKDSLNLILTYSFAAIIRRDSGNSVGALDLFLKAKKIADAFHDKKYKYGVYMSLSEFYKDTDFEKAVAYLKEAYDAAKETGDAGQIANVAFAMAQAELMKKNIPGSKFYLRESLRQAEKTGIAATISYIYSGYANIYKQEKKYDSAIYYRIKAAEIKIKTGDTNRLYDDYGAIGQTYLELKDYKKALEYFSKGKDFASKVGSVNFMTNWGAIMAKAYASSGNLTVAYQVLSEHQVLKDSVMNREKVKAIAEMQVKYEAEKKQQEIELLKKEKALQLLTSRNQQIMFGAALGLVVLAAGVFYFKSQADRQRNIRLSEKVDAQNRELSTIAMLVSKKNNALNQLKERLEKISKENSTAENVNAVLKDIGSEIAFDEEWGTFKYHFEKVHPDFFSKLKQAAPNLSVTELRLCAYLKSNLSTKEISQLTNTTVRSVQQAKYRINQKFKESDANLNHFMVKL